MCASDNTEYVLMRFGKAITAPDRQKVRHNMTAWKNKVEEINL